MHDDSVEDVAELVQQRDGFVAALQQLLVLQGGQDVKDAAYKALTDTLLMFSSEWLTENAGLVAWHVLVLVCAMLAAWLCVCVEPSNRCALLP